MKNCFYDTESILDGTGVTGDNGTDWGGVDETGEKDPDANEVSVWEEEEEIIFKKKFDLFGD